MHDLTRSRTLALALTRTRTITRTLTRCAQSPCTIKDLPAGTNALVKVNAWGQAGEGEPSEYVAAQTEDSDYSRECRETLLAKADGSYVAPGTIVAAVFGGLAFLCLCGGVAYYFKRQKVRVRVRVRVSLPSPSP